MRPSALHPSRRTLQPFPRLVCAGRRWQQLELLAALAAVVAVAMKPFLLVPLLSLRLVLSQRLKLVGLIPKSRLERSDLCLECCWRPWRSIWIAASHSR